MCFHVSETPRTPIHTCFHMLERPKAPQEAPGRRSSCFYVLEGPGRPQEDPRGPRRPQEARRAPEGPPQGSFWDLFWESFLVDFRSKTGCKSGARGKATMNGARRRESLESATLHCSLSFLPRKDEKIMILCLH